MEIEYKLSKQEILRIISKELGVVANAIVLDSNGEFVIGCMVKSESGTPESPQGDRSGGYYVNRFGVEKTVTFLRFFENLLPELKITVMEEYPESKFFYTTRDDGTKKLWLQYDTKKQHLLCRWVDFWLFFEKLGINHSDTLAIVKTEMERFLNIESCAVGTVPHYITEKIESKL
jgi:hypothetical protein